MSTPSERSASGSGNTFNPSVPSTSSGIRHSRSRKRPQPIFNGIVNTYEERSSDFLCPVCFDTIREAYITKCGHSFCYECIRKSLDFTNNCPKCNHNIERPDQFFPNFALNELILKQNSKHQIPKHIKLNMGNCQPPVFQNLIIQDQNKWNLTDVEYMLLVLQHRKEALVADHEFTQYQLLKEFLEHVKHEKDEERSLLTSQLDLIKRDIDRVQKIITQKTPIHSSTPSIQTGASNSIAANSNSSCDLSLKNGLLVSEGEDGFNGSKNGNSVHLLSKTVSARRKRLHTHIEELQDCYFKIRDPHTNTGDNESYQQLDSFVDCLNKFTRFSSMRPLATLNYSTDIYNGSNIVSSIEFDKDSEFFAIAGVTKKIKVYEYGIVIRDTVDIHYPVVEMLCNSKISCICWNPYHKGVLVSSDYEGTLTIWEAFTGTKTKLYEEHEKRCWSVDFNRVDPKLLASGSDDAKVKLWSTNVEHSVASIEAKANVCCVKFNPSSRFHLAFGAADHSVHYYDLRNVKQPVTVFKGHRKAVSYTKFLNSNEIVSASTDSQLKLWSIDQSCCIKTLKGHVNEKNFVGLACNGDFIACGSENNSLYMYYKGLSKHLISYKFDTVSSVLEKDKKEDDVNEFVSAVCWREGSNVVAAANSQGTIKVLELV